MVIALELSIGNQAGKLVELDCANGCRNKVYVPAEFIDGGFGDRTTSYKNFGDDIPGAYISAGGFFCCSRQCREVLQDE